MLILLPFALLAGIVTILSPCILPILPIVLSGSLTGGHRRPLGIVAGFIISFTFFTLFLTTLVKAFGISADVLRGIAIVIIALFGLTLTIPYFQKLSEIIFSKLANLIPKRPSTDTGFLGGIAIGVSLGLVWTPCVGPILATIITLAAASKVTFEAIAITLSYSAGTAIPLLLITYGGRNLLAKAPWITSHTTTIQKVFGVLMLATALLIYFNLDRRFQAYILTAFPQYGIGLTQIEDNQLVRQALEKNYNSPLDESKRGKPMNELVEENLGRAPELILGGQWFNPSTGSGQVPSLATLRGKVVLVDFWTYTCINCIRTLPYLKTWHEKYKDKGLVVIGVHTPEFEFEKDPRNVANALKDFGITYPVMQDNNFATWNAYHNQYWPAKYLIDKNGTIRYTHFGEGKYDETEQWIQKLLAETGALISSELIHNPTYKVEAKTPELYLGYQRTAILIMRSSPLNQSKP